MKRITQPQADNFDMDCSVPPRVRAMLKNATPATLRQIGRELGGYRAAVKVRETTPDASTRKDHLRRMAKLADDLHAMIGMLPADVRQEVESFGHVYHGGERYPVSRLENLEDALPKLAERARAVAQREAPTGRPVLWEEKLLLTNLAGIIEASGAGVTEAADTALAILHVAGVRVSVGSHIATDPRRIILEFQNDYPGA